MAKKLHFHFYMLIAVSHYQFFADDRILYNLA